MNRSGYSNNRRILRTITSKMRQLDSSGESRYLLLYSFLYKYCSDAFESHVRTFCSERSISIDEAYADEFQRQALKNQALKDLGFFITSPEFFISRVMDDYYQDRFFLHAFYSIFNENIEFDEDSKYFEYFKYIFGEMDHAVNFNKFEFVNPAHLIVKEIIFSVAMLDVGEADFPFQKVFDRVCQSKFIGADHDPDYMSSLISSIVASSVTMPADVCNPFLNDASLLIDLHCSSGFSWANTYAKSQDELTHFCSLIRFLIYGFDMNNVFCELASPFEPLDDLSLKFDVIMSRLPPITSKSLKRFSFNQSYEIMKRNRVKQVRSLLSDKLNIDEDSFDQNSELGSALENLLDKIELDLDVETQFVGEYESLRDSEYLFLINMINSLNDDGIMVVSMHQSFLVKNSLKTLRKFLTFEKNYVDAIISIPDELSRPSRLEIIVVFKKNRNSDEIVFIDMSKSYKTKKAGYIVPGLFRRNLILSDDTVSKVLDVYGNHRIIDRFSNAVSISEISRNAFNLSISRYVDTFEGEFIRLEDLMDQKMEIDRNQKRLNERISSMMKELDIRL